VLERLLARRIEPQRSVVAHAGMVPTRC
jgi:hypothetical protein